MTPTDHDFDVLVLGGGSAGYSAALRASQLGLSAALIEADKVGGTCLHRGCIPTKALLHVAEVADSARGGADVGVVSRYEGIDLEKVNRFRDGTVDRLYTGLLQLIKACGIEVISGTGRIIGPHTIEVGDHAVTGRFMVVATGATARTIPGVNLGSRIVTSDQALHDTMSPPRAIVLGGGVIGVEFASMWASFGAQVTILEALPRLIAAEDTWSSAQLERAFRRRGIGVGTGVKVEAAVETEHSVTVALSDGESVEADVLLVAVGRQPRSSGFGLEELGVQRDRGFVVTDDRLHTGIDNVYAIGDLVAGPQLAHRGFQHGLFVAEEIAGCYPTKVPDHHFPRVTYCRPEIASIGFTEAEARAVYGDITTMVYDLGGNGKSQILQTRGGIKVIQAGTRASPGPVVGVHMVGERVSELIGEAQLAVVWEALPDDVARFIHAHPTQNEAFGEAMLAIAARPLHAHR
jgi:dihydrolipoamide dehydrogenase